MRAALSRYVARTLVSELAQDGAPERMRQQRAAVAFIDIRGFTSHAEQMSGAELAAFLSDYRWRIAKPVAEYGGTIDKYIGDGVMIVFGVPRPGPRDAEDALRCVLAIRKAIAVWNVERGLAGRAPIDIAIGLHIGEVVAGVLDDGDRLEFTVLGDTVNVANRIEREAARSDLSLLVSADLLEAAGAPRDREWALAANIVLRGRSTPICLYGLAEELARKSTPASGMALP